ncbi:myo-inositol transporter, putative [Perkinsus marinus ATCC 50983]|uniref:Hexose transporter 1 n=2 Tax=Perkinsus marinus (strain ATCC 50983 / TXsc) TaxID=423536 RepID=C5K7P0_PERM5|nr:myo-inositol transporter, putative [Perkinsus marinus ATCC 50983]EER19575.1 myo-inositol transporter, putative [Perkinsus marinus ATCC 50983]|eukprot:XP_002787779.1 myo-inositol transporter, putative [Perkinsus marinus ATCC 50983]
MKYLCAILSVGASLFGPLMFGLTSGFTGQTIDTMQNGITMSDGTPVQIGPDDHLWVFTNSTEGSLFGSLVNLGAMGGAILLGGPLIEKFGRKWILLGCSPCFVLCYVWQALAHTSWQLLFERVLVGFVVGVESVVTPTYIGEVSPTKIRGALGACNQLSITIGILIAYALGLGFRTDAGSTDPNANSSTFCQWRDVSWIYLIPSALLGICVFFVPESPRWLAEHNRVDAAKRVLLRLRGSKTVEEDPEIVEEVKAYEAEAENDAKNAKGNWKETAKWSWHALGRAKMQLFIGVVLQILQQLSGINAVIFYQTTIFQAAGLDNKETMALAVMAVQVVVTFIACIVMDMAGRRFLLVLGAVGMCIAAILLGVFFFEQGIDDNNIPALALFAAFLYIASFSIGVGAIPWLIMSEIFPNEVRGLASSIATATNWFFSWIVTMFLDDYRQAITYQGVFWSFAFMCFVMVVFVLLFIPETKGRSFETIQAYFDEGHIINCECLNKYRNRQKAVDNSKVQEHSDSSTDNDALQVSAEGSSPADLRKVDEVL